MSLRDKVIQGKSFQLGKDALTGLVRNNSFNKLFSSLCKKCKRKSANFVKKKGFLKFRGDVKSLWCEDCLKKVGEVDNSVVSSLGGNDEEGS